jgi:8-oxo-dGTP pyrophosphatase MutT (NUDIX family)
VLEKALQGKGVAGATELEGPLAPGAKAAAVASIFRDGSQGLEVLLIRRAERTGDPWSGHMAFPGGRRDPIDADLRATALRETREEIGLDLEAHGALLGVLDDQEATSSRVKLGMPIRPFVFELVDRDVPLSPNEEVNELVWTSVGPLIQGERDTSIEVTYENVRYTLPAFDVEGRTVWGLTYRMLQQIFSQLRAAR